MKYASLSPSAFSSGLADLNYSSFTQRIAGRAVILKDKSIALVYVSKHGYYMLPGGGVSNEDIKSELEREIKEELGCRIAFKFPVGKSEVYFDRWQQKQIDYCYVAEVIGEQDELSINDFEREEGHKIVWATDLRGAIQLMESAQPQNMDGRLIQARDLAFLKETKELLR